MKALLHQFLLEGIGPLDHCHQHLGYCLFSGDDFAPGETLKDAPEFGVAVRCPS
jgi:hypothetical protein